MYPRKKEEQFSIRWDSIRILSCKEIKKTPVRIVWNTKKVISLQLNKFIEAMFLQS